jgi:hypothetical protein
MRRTIASALPLLTLGAIAACGAATGHDAASALPSPARASAGAYQPPPPPASPVVPGAVENRAKTEEYKDYGVNPVVDPAEDRLSTFAIDGFDEDRVVRRHVRDCERIVVEQIWDLMLDEEEY